MDVVHGGDVRGWERDGRANELGNGKYRRTYSKQVIIMCRVKDNDNVLSMQKCW